MSAMQWIFWSALGFCAYTLFGYALCLGVLGIFRGRTRQRRPIEPSVSILIAVRGAEAIIEKKLRNCLALDYPEEKLEIVVACDGPSTATEAIVRSLGDPRIRLVGGPPRGKSFALGAALENSSGEIVVFTDAAVSLDSCGVRQIVSNFADPKVGCVSSEDVTSRASGNAEPLYISFDMLLRRLESRVRSLVNASGAFFAARREVCRNWDIIMSSDFFVPLRTLEAGFDVIVDPRARGYVASVQVEQEFARKVRTIVHGLHVFFNHWRLLNPLAHGLVSWELASHKLCRWLLPFAFLALLLANCALWHSGPLYRVALICQLAIYGAGVLALPAKRLRKLLPFKVAAFFLLGNAATVLAWRKFLGGERYVSWQPSRRSAVAD